MNQKEDLFNELKSRKIDSPDAEYFNNMSQSIIDANSKNIFSRKKIYSIVAIAASIALLFLVYPNSVTKPTEFQIDSVQLSNYIDNNIDDFSEELIIECLESTIVSFDNGNETIDDLEITLETIDNDIIFDYLIEEDFDTDDLLI